jgi:hypothetical protein
MATLKKNKVGKTSEEDELEVTIRTAASLKQALLGLGTTFIKGILYLRSPLFRNEDLSRTNLIGAYSEKFLYVNSCLGLSSYNMVCA